MPIANTRASWTGTRQIFQKEQPVGQRRRLRRWLQLVLLALCAFVVSACQTDADLTVVVENDGSGVIEFDVALDAEAANDIVDLSQSGLPLTDLAQAGWTIDPPAVGDDAVTRFGVSKAFGTPEQFTEIIQELDGGSGVFTDFEIVRSAGFATVDYQVNGTVSPQSFNAFGDDSLAATLGRSIESITDHYGATPADVSITVTVYVPGEVSAEDSTGESADRERGTARVWTTDLGAVAPTEVTILATTTEVIALVWRGVAIVTGVLAVLVAFGQVLRIVLPERRRRKKKKKQAETKKVTATAKRTAAELTEMKAARSDAPKSKVEGEGDSSPLVIALDGMGVLYREGNDTTNLLIPFVREMGSLASEQDIIRGSRLLSLGRLTPADFWKGIGLSGDPNEIDAAYLSLHQLTPGVVAWLRASRANGTRVAVITNDSSVWANKLRKRHSLNGLIDPWIVSGSVGVRKPDRPLFEVLRRLTETPADRILVVDDELDNLDAAASFGFQTAWFAPDADANDSRGHQILRSFKVAKAPAKAAAKPSAKASAKVAAKGPVKDAAKGPSNSKDGG